MTTRQITEFDIVFLSYDEPNAEKHWADLLDKAPWATRVHGVKGFDSAHRAAANQSTTDWFITVDADNIVLPSFFDLTIDLNDATDLNKSFCWDGLNMMNGLQYGNGGLKLWSKKFASQMSCHEFSKSGQDVDFCWDPDYFHMPGTYSQVWNNGSAYQAFRVGYREGIKLALDRGQRVLPEFMKSKLHPMNLRNLRIWSSVGGDVDHGLFALLGARQGWFHVCDPDYDITQIRDYDWFDNYWNTDIHPTFHNRHGVLQVSTLLEYLEFLGNKIKEQTKITVPMLNADQSIFFRETFNLIND